MMCENAFSICSSAADDPKVLIKNNYREVIPTLLPSTIFRATINFLTILLLLVYIDTASAQHCSQATKLDFLEPVSLNADEKQFIKSTPELKISAIRNGPPLTDFDRASETFRGISVDIFCTIADHSGINYKWSKHNEQNLNELIAQVQEGDIDLLMSISKNSDRDKLGIFSEPFFQTHYIILGHRNTLLNITNLDDLQNYRIGIYEGSAGALDIQNKVPEKNLYYFKTNESSKAPYEALRNKKIDILIQNRSFFYEHRYKHQLFDLQVFQVLRDSTKKYAFYFHKNENNDKLVSIFNKYLAAIDVEQAVDLHTRTEEELIEDLFNYKARHKRLLAFSIFMMTILAWMIYARKKKLQIDSLKKRATSKILKQKKHLERANKRLSILATAIEQSPTSIIITDENGYIQHVNKKFTEISGYELEDVKGKTPRILKSGFTPDSQYEFLWESIRSGVTWRGEFYNKSKSGKHFWERAAISPVFDSEGKIINYIAIKEDVNQLKEQEKNLKIKTYYDSLTKLPNQTYFDQKVNSKLEDKSNFTIAIINLDGFQKINIGYTHSGGDKLICLISQRLSEVIKNDGFLARLGSDEFALLLPTDMTNQVKQSLEAIMNAIRAPIELRDKVIMLTARIGVVIAPNHGKTLYELQRNVFSALHRAKLDGGNKIYFFKQDVDDKLSNTISLESELKLALSRNEFELHYQPQIYNGKTLGAEALIRWNSSEFGRVPPDRFIPLAESNGLIIDIGKWVLKTACSAAVNWPEEISISVNISPQQFIDSNLVSTIDSVLSSTGLNPKRLQIEVTESLMQNDTTNTERILKELSSRGIEIALDDFGTGYSSLGLINQLPFSILKLDRCFINDIVSCPRSKNLCHAIVGMANTLGLSVIAEGIEEKVQLELLQSWGVQWYQGYYFSRPLPLNDFEKLITL